MHAPQKLLSCLVHEDCTSSSQLPSACRQAVSSLPSSHTLPPALPRPARQVALPLSLCEVGARLASGYYRQPEAVQSDLATIAANAATFNGSADALAEDAAALAAYLTAVLHGQVRWWVGGWVVLGLAHRSGCREDTLADTSAGSLAERESSSNQG